MTISLVMTIENSTDNLTSDSVKTLLLQEPKLVHKKFFHGVLLVKPKSLRTVNAVKYCCDDVGHMTKNCTEREEKKRTRLL